MTFEELENDMYHIYNDYQPEYSYGFIAGIIHASFIVGKIAEEQRVELDKRNASLYSLEKNTRNPYKNNPYTDRAF